MDSEGGELSFPVCLSSQLIMMKVLFWQKILSLILVRLNYCVLGFGSFISSSHLEHKSFTVCF